MNDIPYSHNLFVALKAALLPYANSGHELLEVAEVKSPTKAAIRFRMQNPSKEVSEILVIVNEAGSIETKEVLPPIRELKPFDPFGL